MKVCDFGLARTMGQCYAESVMTDYVATRWCASLVCNHYVITATTMCHTMVRLKYASSFRHTPSTSLFVPVRRGEQTQWMGAT